MSGETAVIKITKRIEDKTEKRIQEILKEQEEAIKRINEETEEKIKEIREKILKDAQNKANIIFQKEKAKYELEYKLKLSKFRDELVNALIDKVKEELKKQVGTRKYLQSLEDSIISAIITLKEPEVIVYVRKEDHDKVNNAFLNNIVQKVRDKYGLEVKISVSDKFINCLGGVIVESLDGKLRINNTYDIKLERHADEIRNKVAAEIIKE